jgi:hypothetical protein
MKTKLIISVLALAGITMAYKLINSTSHQNQPIVAMPPDVAVPSNFNIIFNPLPPNELDVDATPQELVEFAWEEFLALNWKSSYSKNKKRDCPDTTWTFSNSNPDTLVWETYAHRAELRPFFGPMKDFDNPPSYSFGVKPMPKVGSNASFTLFDVLDENNEIGSCNLFAHVNSQKQSMQVLYQAKVNREEYNYIKNKYPNTAKLDSARVLNIRNLKKYGSYSKDSVCYCMDTLYQGISLPCGSKSRQGTMEVKTAWRQLNAGEDPSKFLMRKVVVFSKQNDTCIYENKMYALIALHIIHKTRNYPQFVFATWEHVGVTKDNMGYILLDGNGKESGNIVADYKRFAPITAIVDSSTSYVHRQLKNKNANSVWLNYRLVGVQGHPSNDSTTFNFFLANYVVESDPTLADFHGSSIGSPHDHQPNTYTNGKVVSMGGCQGCHGVAQKTIGSDFSFLLDTVGKPIKYPDIRNDGNKMKALKQL